MASAGPGEPDESSIENIGKRKVKAQTISDSDFSDEYEESDVEEDYQLSNMSNEEVNIEFEGHSVKDSDFHGIKMLLQQLFVMMPVNTSQLTNIVIAQKQLGSILKVTDDDERTIYGITTLIYLHKNMGNTFVEMLFQALEEKCKEVDEEIEKRFKKLLEKKLGLLIGERFVNIPADVSLPLYNSLSEEIKEAKGRGDIEDLDYLLFIAKSVKPVSAKDISNGNEASESSTRKKIKLSREAKAKKAKSANKNEKDLQFINPEDEIFFKESVLAFSYQVTKATGFAISGGWDVNDVTLDTYRTVMFIEYKQFHEIVEKIEMFLNS